MNRVKLTLRRNDAVPVGGFEEGLVSSEESGDQNRAKPVGQIVLTASGWIAALLLGLLDLPSKINSFRKELPSAAEATGIWVPIDQRFEGAWGRATTCNDDPYHVGDLTDGADQAASIGHGLDLTLKFNGSNVSGEILSEGLRQHFIFPEVEIVGRASGSTARVRIFDWIDAKPVTLAMADLTRIGTNCLKFSLVGEKTAIFPDTALLVRQADAEYRAISRESSFSRKLLERAAHRAKRSAAN